MTLPDGWQTVYADVGANYRAIDDLRLKLLGLLPLATSAGIFLVLKPDSGPPGDITVLGGIFGAVVTVSLFFYEVHGVEKCAHFIRRGQQLELQAGVPGSFTKRPHKIFGVVSELLPGAIIYPASLAGWIFVATTLLGWALGGIHGAFLLAVGTLLAGVAATGSIIYVRERRRPSEWELEEGEAS